MITASQLYDLINCPHRVGMDAFANLTPADVYHGRDAKILKIREEIKKQTIQKRRLQHQSAAA